jgi:hypothetical protein
VLMGGTPSLERVSCEDTPDCALLLLLGLATG